MRKRDLKLDGWNISKNRYRELIYFCRQYTEWKDELKYQGDGVRSPSFSAQPKAKGENGLEKIALRRVELMEKCKEIEQAAMAADGEIYEYIIKNVTEGAGYQYLKMIMGIPAGQAQFYQSRRKFFWMLDKKNR